MPWPWLAFCKKSTIFSFEINTCAFAWGWSPYLWHFPSRSCFQTLLRRLWLFSAYTTVTVLRRAFHQHHNSESRACHSLASSRENPTLWAIGKERLSWEVVRKWKHHKRRKLIQGNCTDNQPREVQLSVKRIHQSAYVSDGEKTSTTLSKTASNCQARRDFGFCELFLPALWQVKSSYLTLRKITAFPNPRSTVGSRVSLKIIRKLSGDLQS